MDLIDRDALLEQIDIDSDGNEGQYGDEWQFMDTIKNMPSTPQWIPCSERLPEEGQVVLVIMGKSHKLDWEEQRFVEFGRISNNRYDCSGTGWEWLNESAADFWEPDWNNRAIAWMPIPAYEETDYE